jgi:hypothetical protein
MDIRRNDGLDITMEDNEVEDYLNTIVVHMAVLTDWEENFINDMVRKYQGHETFTSKQLFYIDRIYNKVENRYR